MTDFAKRGDAINKFSLVTLSYIFSGQTFAITASETKQSKWSASIPRDLEELNAS